MERSEDAVVAGLLARHGQSHAEELGLDLSENTPEALFLWLCATLLLSARISADLAMRAAAAVREEGWTSAAALGRSTWARRVEVLNGAGYARFDEKTATMLGELAEKVRDTYDDDLRALREMAERDPAAERRLVMEFKGIGEVGADIFLREVQRAWPELYPFADARARAAAGRLGLPEAADALAARVARADFPRFLAALVRADLAGEEADDLRAAAAAPES